MIACVVTAIVFSIPTVYYRIRLKKAEEKLSRHIKTRRLWEDWGE
jgi:hypothetical protein|tara:strand:- start:500 stop:634 length:135 start_codon:yes stop_codon:yes gene_type:complete